MRFTTGRGIRLVLSAVVAFALVGVWGNATAAPTGTEFTVAWTNCEVISGTTSERVPGRTHWGSVFTSGTWRCSIEASDPRANGTETLNLTFNWVGRWLVDGPFKRVPFRGVYLLQNQGGSWEGVVTGHLQVTAIDPSVPSATWLHIAQVVASGHGSYEGLHLRLENTEWVGTGAIWG